jgi:adenylylsulfate kinase
LRAVGLHPVVLDGDEVRQAIAPNAGFDLQTRLQLGNAYASLAGLIASQGYVAIVATISLFHELHTANRQRLPNYYEVFLDVPAEVRKARDPKGLYRSSAPNVVGTREVPGQEPIAPHMKISYDPSQTAEDIAERLFDAMGLKRGVPR